MEQVNAELPVNIQSKFPPALWLLATQVKSLDSPYADLSVVAKRNSVLDKFDVNKKVANIVANLQQKIEAVEKLIQDYEGPMTNKLVEIREFLVNARAKILGLIVANRKLISKDDYDIIKEPKNKSLYKELKSILLEIEEADGIKTHFRTYLFEIIDKIMNGVAKSESLAKDLDTCLKYYCYRNPNEFKLLDEDFGSAQTMFTFFLEILYPKYKEYQPYITTQHPAELFLEDSFDSRYSFPQHVVKETNRRWLLAGYLRCANKNHFLSCVYRGDKKADYMILDNFNKNPKPKAQSSDEACACILNEEKNHSTFPGEVIKDTFAIAVNPDIRSKNPKLRDGLDTPRSENWVIPERIKNNCYLSAAFIQLCTYHFYVQQFQSKGIIT